MKLRSIIDEIPVRYFYRIAFLANNFRDPLLRKVENENFLTRPEVMILFCLAYRDGANPVDIARITQQPKNTISRGAALLADKGMITKDHDPNDGRRSVLQLTREGLAKYREIYPLFEETERKMLTGLSHDDLVNLDELLSRLCDNVHFSDQSGSEPT